MLFLSLFHLDLENLPDGRFERVRLEPQQAAALIQEARGTGRLSGGTSSDWHIDSRALSRSVELMDACARLDPPVRIKLDDFGDSHLFPLSAFRVEPGAQLLVVSCCYRFRRHPSVSRPLEIDDGSITFSLFRSV